jgi:hypothetical protein
MGPPAGELGAGQAEGTVEPEAGQPSEQERQA